MVTVFGEDLSERTLKYIINGEEKLVNIPFALRDNFSKLGFRVFTPQIALFPETFKLLLTQNDRNDVKNAKQLRSFFQEIIDKRKKDKELKGGIDDRGDILTVLLEDDLFKDNQEYIIDECLTFFFAATQTQAIQTSNTLCYFAQQPEILKKAKQELEAKIIQPYLREHNLEKLEFNQLVDILNIETS